MATWENPSRGQIGTFSLQKALKTTKVKSFSFSCISKVLQSGYLHMLKEKMSFNDFSPIDWRLPAYFYIYNLISL